MFRVLLVHCKIRRILVEWAVLWDVIVCGGSGQGVEQTRRQSKDRNCTSRKLGVL